MTVVDCVPQGVTLTSWTALQQCYHSAYLVGAMRAAKLLDCLVSAPGQLDGQVHPPPLVCTLDHQWDANVSACNRHPVCDKLTKDAKSLIGVHDAFVCTAIRKDLLQRLRTCFDACSEMPVEAASETMAMSFLPFMNASVSRTFSESSSALSGLARSWYMPLRQIICTS